MCVIVVGKQQIIFIHTKYQIPTKSNQIKSNQIRLFYHKWN